MPKIFISYRRVDTEHITGRIHDRLAPHFGRDNVFMDIDTIPFGVDFRQHLSSAFVVTAYELSPKARRAFRRRQRRKKQ